MNTEISNKFAEQDARIAELEALVAALRVTPAAAPKKGKKAAAGGAEKEARKPSEGNLAWVAKVNETVTEMRSNGWESWTDASGNVFAASKPATVDGRETHVFTDTGKEPNYSKGGLARASYLKTRDSPEEQAKTRARAAKRAEVVAAKKAGSSSEGEAAVAEKPKRTLSDEQKAKMKAGREAKKAGGAPAAAAAPELVSAPEPAAPAPAAAAAPKPKVKIATKKPEPKVYDLSFNGWAFNGEDYITNERGDVLTLEGDWVGRFNGKVIDESVERPTDIDAFLTTDE